MNRSSLFYSLPGDRVPCMHYRTAVSLHSHTLHSQESLTFIPAVARKVPLLAAAMRWQQARYGVDLDLSRAWWTPPLSPMDAWRVESGQIISALSMQPLVSLTDHDNIEAAKMLSVADAGRRHPISIEWTVPFGESYFHLGVHNLPRSHSTEIVHVMNEFSSQPRNGRLREILCWLHESPEVLVVLNHPLWDEKGIGPDNHIALVEKFTARLCGFIHAIEMNGLRPWRENMSARELAHSLNLPVISGGDRHGREPNATINVTNASSFSEFVAEIRRDRWSRPVFLEHYGDSHAWRVTQTICDVLRDDPGHGHGWSRWSDRIFYRCDDGAPRSLTVLWGDQPPALVRYFVALAHFAGDHRFREALRFAFARKQEALS